MRKRLIFLIFLTIASFSASAQSVITGWVSDKSDKKSIDGVVITLLNRDGATAAYAITKRDGSFTIQIQNDAPSFTMHARLLGYKEHTRQIDNKSQTLYIQLDFGEIELREVVVKSKPMWNREDTLVYSVDAFKTLSDKTIGDLLKKLPGVEVSESGGIKYQGENINKFYIEGLDLLEKRYGIATNNVPVDAVQNVEVIENHQPLKTLKESVPSANAAINLRLRKDKMARPVGTVTLGAGYADNMLWLAEAFALTAGKNKQSIVMYKGNNAAKEITSELASQTLSVDNLQDVSGYSLKSLLNARSFNYPPLEKKRFLFNKSHTVSANNLWKTSENSQIRLNAQYLHHSLQENTVRNSEYYLPDGTLQIVETNRLSHRTHAVDAALTFTNNSEAYYLNNALTWSGNWDKATSSVAANGMGVLQQFHLPAHTVKNELKYVKRHGKRVWDFTSFTAYSHQPQWLTVEVDTLDTPQKQQVNLSGFYTRNSTYYNWGWRNSSFIIKGAVEASIDNYRSELSHPVFTDSVRSKIKSDDLLVELTPTYMYRDSHWTINADVSLKNHFLTIHHQLNSMKKDNLRHFFANPSLRVNYRFSPMLSVRASYKYTESIGDFLDLTDVYFMSSYRNFYKRTGILSRTNRKSINASLQYRNPLTTFFCNTTIAYAPSTRNMVSTQRFVGNESVAGNEELSTHSDMWMWVGYLGKYFSELRTNVSLNISYNQIKSERRQQGVLFPLVAGGWSLMPKATVKLSDASSVSYQAVASNRFTKITRANNTLRSNMWQVTQQLSAFYLIGNRWQLNGRLEHSYNELGEKNNVKIFFADLSVTYKHRLMEIDLSANNLFNQDNYSYSTFNGLDRFDYVYKLQPRMVMVTVSHKF